MTTELARTVSAGLAVPAELTKVSLSLPADISEGQSWDVGKALGAMDGSSAWWKGDWSRQHAEKWAQGDVARQSEETGIDDQTLRHCRVVSDAFELCRRRHKLSWGHHDAVLGLSDPDEQDDVLAWAEAEEKSVAEVRAEVKRRNKPETPMLPAGKYRVMYADPPWSYDNSGFAQSAAAHYPTMSTEEICALDVRGLAADDCALFLWATSPLLPDALSVMAAWGFTYKASMIWVKDRAPGIGWFVNTKHELLLIGVRGEDVHPAEKVDSVIGPLKVTEHSRKPDEFAALIEVMYGGEDVPKVELSARRERLGWKVWGNEVGAEE